MYVYTYIILNKKQRLNKLNNTFLELHSSKVNFFQVIKKIKYNNINVINQT